MCLIAGSISSTNRYTRTENGTRSYLKRIKRSGIAPLIAMTVKVMVRWISRDGLYNTLHIIRFDEDNNDAFYFHTWYLIWPVSTISSIPVPPLIVCFVPSYFFLLIPNRIHHVSNRLNYSRVSRTINQSVKGQSCRVPLLDLADRYPKSNNLKAASKRIESISST